MISIESQERAVRERAWLEAHGFKLEMNVDPPGYAHYAEPCPVCRGYLREDNTGSAFLFCMKCGWRGI